MTMPTLFGENHIKIEDNPLLEGIANHILDLVAHDQNLIKGKTVGEINNKLMRAIWEDEGVSQVLTKEQLDQFFTWYDKSKSRIGYDGISRALRYLVHDLGVINLPAEAILDAERHRQRIQRSVK